MVLGWDMGAAIAMAEALGMDARAATEFLPVLEAVMARRLNDRMEGRSNGEP